MTDGEALTNEYDQGGVTYAALATRHKLTRGQVASRIRNYRKTSKPKIIGFPVGRKVYEPPKDWDAWNDTLSSLARRGWITVAHDCDLHLPDHDENAVNMRYRLYARKQPDVIIVGSDAADFDVLSKFEGDPDAEEGVSDALHEFRSFWYPHIDNLNRICPNAIKVWIYGNHDQRLINHIGSNAPTLRRTVMDAWLTTLRYGGSLYIGRTEEVEISNLLVIHGNRANEHTAKSLLDDQSYQVNVMAGHVHRLTSYDREGRRYMVRAITSGCAQKLRPEYVRSKGRSMTRKWQHGVGFATVNMHGTDAFFDNVRFTMNEGKMIAFSDGNILEQAA